jgi:hypothetical protein
MAMPIRNHEHGQAVLTLKIKIKPNPGTTSNHTQGHLPNPEPARKKSLSHSTRREGGKMKEGGAKKWR